MERLLGDDRPPAGEEDVASAHSQDEPPLVRASRLTFDDVIKYGPVDWAALNALHASLPPSVMDGKWTQTILDMREMDEH